MLDSVSLERGGTRIEEEEDNNWVNMMAVFIRFRFFPSSSYSSSSSSSSFSPDGVVGFTWSFGKGRGS